MIYLIDDNSNRQVGYGWTLERFERFKSLIRIIHTYDEVDEALRKSIFTDGNIVLFHESFFDNPINQNLENSSKIKEDLIQFAERKKDRFTVVLFSGSNGSRYRNDNIIYMPVDIVYNNLDSFLQNGVYNNSHDINYLLYGNNPKIESELILKLEEFNEREFGLPDYDDSDFKNFIALTLENEIPKPFKTSTSESFFEDDITDEYLNNVVIEWFANTKYDNIFIPLCFGSTLSDFNGLKMAAHVRCTDTVNRSQNIFIYGFFENSQLLLNKYFDILKTKNVFLIDYSKESFEDALKMDLDPYGLHELPGEIKKLKLDPPKDNHKISNEWAIYRWAETINVLDSDIEKIIKDVDSNLYFKYLQTIYPISLTSKIDPSNLKIKHSGTPKVLFIDDEAGKGWYEIMCNIIYEINGIKDFQHIGDELKSKSKDEIVEYCTTKVKDDNIEIVILDYRLHQEDLYERDISEITGLKILKKIKEINPGIQVIIFSATNKLWNLQAIQNAGADGFVIKESPENSVDLYYTSQTINQFKYTLANALKRTFLKQLFILCFDIKENIRIRFLDADESFELFLKDLHKQITVIESAAKKIDLNDSMTMDIIFLNCYNFLEKFKHFYLHQVDNHFVLGVEEIEMNRYRYFAGQIANEGKFIRNNINDSPSWFNTLTGILIDYFYTPENDKVIKDLNKIKEKRNEYIHGHKSSFDRNELLLILNICELITYNLRE